MVRSELGRGVNGTGPRVLSQRASAPKRAVERQRTGGTLRASQDDGRATLRPGGRGFRSSDEKPSVAQRGNLRGDWLEDSIQLLPSFIGK